MKIAIMQPYFFPYIGYWQLIHAVDLFVIYDDAHYINKGYINRNSILVNGQIRKITLELLGASQNKLINEITVGHNGVTLLQTIERVYKKAPLFHEVFSLIEMILLNKEKNLAQFLQFSLKKISSFLGINTQFMYSSEIVEAQTLKAQDKIIAICKKLGAIQYINAIGGQSLYGRDFFKRDNIELSFLKTEAPPYLQFNKEFVPHLSIIDVLMFNSRTKASEILSQYQLI